MEGGRGMSMKGKSCEKNIRIIGATDLGKLRTMATLLARIIRIFIRQD